MAGLYAPLTTLRSHPRGGLRTDRGRRGLLLLHRSGLSPHTPCRSPGALTRVAACTLARSPIRDPLSEGFRHFVSSMPAPVASGWSESPGGACTHWKAPPCHGARGEAVITPSWPHSNEIDCAFGAFNQTPRRSARPAQPHDHAQKGCRSACPPTPTLRRGRGRSPAPC